MTLRNFFTQDLVLETQHIPRCSALHSMDLVRDTPLTYHFECGTCIKKRIESIPSDLRSIVSDFASQNKIPFEKAMTLVLQAKKTITETK